MTSTQPATAEQSDRIAPARRAWLVVLIGMGMVSCVLLVAVGQVAEPPPAGGFWGGSVLLTIWFLLTVTLLALAKQALDRERRAQEGLELQERKVEELLKINVRFLDESDALDEHAIVSATDIHGTIQYANTKFCEISGYTPEELLGENHRILNSNTHPPEFFRRMWRTITAGRVWHGLVCNRAKDGHHYWVNSTIVPIRNGTGEIDKLISIRTEVTALVEAQEALRQTQQELLAAKEEAERQREIAEAANRKKSEFLASMSHELRTPMNSILGFSQILQMEELGEEAQEQVSHIHNAGHHLLRLINDVLDLSRIETGNLALDVEAVDLRKVLDATIQTIAPLAQRAGIALKLETLEENVFVEADAHRLQQVLLNLVSNAIKYNRAQGKVWVTVEKKLSRVRISVSDTGVGLSPEEMKNLFEPYTRFAPRSVEGTGIGLTITKRIVEAMGGNIGVNSNKNVGSTFWLDLKPAQTLAPTASISCLPDAQRPKEIISGPLTGTILYIEDNPANQQLIRKALKNYPNLNLLIAPAPYTGLQMAQRQHPDLILLDINLPEFDGFEVFRRLRAEPMTRCIPVVGVSANAMPWDLERAKAAGFDDYLAKPVNVFTLQKIVRQYLHPKAA